MFSFSDSEARHNTSILFLQYWYSSTYFYISSTTHLFNFSNDFKKQYKCQAHIWHFLNLGSRCTKHLWAHHKWVKHTMWLKVMWQLQLKASKNKNEEGYLVSVLQTKSIQEEELAEYGTHSNQKCNFFIRLLITNNKLLVHVFGRPVLAWSS